jgi:hypothetical protein
MLPGVWAFPSLAALVALVFAAMLLRRFVRNRRSYLALWAVALLMYALASGFVALGALNGWTTVEFRVYWALGAVLNVPFLAQGELDLLIRSRWVRSALYVVLAFVVAYTIARVRTATINVEALSEQLPSGKDVLGDGTPVHRLPQLVSIPAYLVLIGGTLWSAWWMRGRPELRDRFWGTLLIAFGASVIAIAGSAFAAAGLLLPFSVSLLIGVTVMFAGFLRASRRNAPGGASAPTT